MKPLLNRLRIRLTLLYIAVGMVLAGAIGVGTYGLVSYYLRTTTDTALKLKMGIEFVSLNLPVPKDLYVSLVKAGLVTENSAILFYFEGDIRPQVTPQGTETADGEGMTTPEATETPEVHPAEKVQISELADIVVLPLTVEGTPIQGIVITNYWLPIDKTAIASAIVSGSDIRTIKLEDGTPVRLLTYRVTGPYDIGIIQVARSLKTQQEMMGDLLGGVIVIGAISILILGIAAWMSAGRSIKPMQLAWEKQQDFVANASHELRTPLTLIHAGVEMAQRGAASDTQRQVLDDVLVDANYMTKLIESLLLLSRLDSHHLPIELQTVQLTDLLEEIVRQSGRVAEGKGVSLSFESDPISVTADPVRLKQLLLILIENAVRNNHPGGRVKISVKVKHDKAFIEVSDNGAGIPKEYQAKLFERFYKVNDRSTPDYRGSGLGLSIAQGLVQAMGGEIELVSEEGKGTRATFSIPLAKLPLK
jgi:signal transduction histidine kinase